MFDVCGVEMRYILVTTYVWMFSDRVMVVKARVWIGTLNIVRDVCFKLYFFC